jgi:hypothetical protein
MSRFLVEQIHADEVHTGDGIMIVDLQGMIAGSAPGSRETWCLWLQSGVRREIPNDSVVLRIVRDTGMEQVDPAVIERYRERS